MEMEAQRDGEPTKARLLQFITGLSALPVGGLSCLRRLLGPPAPPNDGVTVDLMRTDATGNARSAAHLRKAALPRYMSRACKHHLTTVGVCGCIRARTCTGQLRMPAYETAEELRTAFRTALALDDLAPGFGLQ